MEHIAQYFVHSEQIPAYLPICKDVHDTSQPVVKQKNQGHDEDDNQGDCNDGIEMGVHHLDILEDPETPGYGLVRRHHERAYKEYAVKQNVQYPQTGCKQKYLLADKPDTAQH
jgi:hypothetical protein